MRRLLRWLGLPLLAACLLAAPAWAAPERFWLQVVDETGNPIASGVTVHVYTTNTVTTATIYTDQTLGTGKTNPGTADASGVFDWWADSAATANFDVLVLSQQGSAKLSTFTTTGVHSVRVYRHERVKLYRTAIGAAAGAETSTGVQVPTGSIFLYAIVELIGYVGPARTFAVGNLSSESGGSVTAVCNNSSFGASAFNICTPTATVAGIKRTLSYSHSGYTGSGYITWVYMESHNR